MLDAVVFDLQFTIVEASQVVIRGAFEGWIGVYHHARVTIYGVVLSTSLAAIVRATTSDLSLCACCLESHLLLQLSLVHVQGDLDRVDWVFAGKLCVEALATACSFAMTDQGLQSASKGTCHVTFYSLQRCKVLTLLRNLGCPKFQEPFLIAFQNCLSLARRLVLLCVFFQ